MTLAFGVTIRPEGHHSRVVDLAQRAEQSGFDFVWTYDSHIVFCEPYPLLTLMAAGTTRVRLGLWVSNPRTRDPTVTASAFATLQNLSGGRMVLGLGQGDSACRMIGLEPATVDETERAIQVIKNLAAGRPTVWNGLEIRLEWAGAEVPIYVAGSGPRMNALAGRVGDGVVIPVADPVAVEWFITQAREAAAASGRDPDALEFAVSAPTFVSNDLGQARDEVRWYPAMVSNWVGALLERHGDASALPPELADFVHARVSYNYREHAQVRPAHAGFVSDDVCDRFCLIGPVDHVVARLAELEAIGVRQWNAYLMTHDQEKTIDVYGREVIPALSS